MKCFELDWYDHFGIFNKFQSEEFEMPEQKLLQALIQRAFYDAVSTSDYALSEQALRWIEDLDSTKPFSFKYCLMFLNVDDSFYQDFQQAMIKEIYEQRKHESKYTSKRVLEKRRLKNEH